MTTGRNLPPRLGMWVLTLVTLLICAVLPCSADVPRDQPHRSNAVAEIRTSKSTETSQSDPFKPIEPEIMPEHEVVASKAHDPQPPRPAYAAGQLVVGLESTYSASNHAPLFGSHSATVQSRLAHGNAYVVKVPEGQEIATMIAFEAESAVAYAEPAYLYYPAYEPNDPYYVSDQWHYRMIQIPAAWDLTTGSSNVIVAVLDTGLDLTHQDCPVNVVSGTDTVNVDDDPSDDHGHGTHVAGTVAAATDNGMGVAGIAPGTTIMLVKVLSPDGGTSIQVANGIYWAVDQGADIINLSLGSTYASQTIKNAVDYAYTQGVAIVAAAGNDYEKGSPIHYPAAFNHVLAVAATGDHDEHATYSTAGDFVDIAAPGGNPASGNDWIWSITWRGTGQTYSTNAGTSMAAPHVAGVLALLKAMNPAMTVDELYERVCATALDLGDAGHDELYGWGRIDAYAAMTNGDASSSPGMLGPDVYEPDDSAAKANAIALGATQENHNIHVTGDVDWCSFDVPAGGRNITIETSGPEGETDDTYLALYAADGATWIASDDDSGDDHYSRIEVYLAEGRYTFRASRYGNLGTIDSYDISITGGAIAVPEDAWEPDDDPALSPYPEPLDMSQSGRTLHEPTDVDRAQFVVSELSDVVIETQGPSGDTIMALYDEDWDTQIAWDDESGDGEFSRITAELDAATYSVLIWEDGQNSTIGLYDLTITGESLASPISPDAYEPDDTPGTASTMNLNDTQLDHNIDHVDDDDWTLFTLDATALVVIETSGPDGTDYDTELSLWNDDGTNLIAYDDDGGVGTYSRLTAELTPGTYAIQARSYDHRYEIASYDLTLTAVPDADAYEPDDTAAVASQLVGGGQRNHSIHALSDEDWIAFEVAHAGLVTMYTTGASADDTMIALWDGSGTTLLAEDDDSGTMLYSQIEIELQPGAYALQIWEYAQNDYIAAYDVVFVFDIAEDAYEPDDDMSQASQLTNGQPQTHSLHEIGDVDWMRYDIAQVNSPTELHAATFSTAGASGDTTLSLHDGGGQLLATDDNSGDGDFSEIVIGCDTGLVPGAYYLKVESASYGDQRELIAEYTITGQSWLCLGTLPDGQNPAEVWLRALGSDAAGWDDIQTHPRCVGDVNGDDLADIVAFGQRATCVSLSDGSSYGTPQVWIRAYGPDAGGWANQDTYPRALGDVNGDDRDDIVAFGDRATYVSLSNGTGFGPPSAWIAWYGPTSGGWTSQDEYPRLVGDVNGDGRDDIVGFGERATYVSLSTGSSFQEADAWINEFGTKSGGWTSQDTYPRILSDVNGDGRDDVIALGRETVYVAESTGASFADPTAWTVGLATTSSGWPSQDSYPRLVSDVDGDDRADIVAFGQTATYAGLSTTGELGLFSSFYNVQRGWTSQNQQHRVLGDANGDGKADVIGFGANGVVVQISP